MFRTLLLFCGIILFSILPTPVCAQKDDGEWEDVLQSIAEELGEDAEAQNWEAQMETLNELHENPIDLNSATREQLLALPFLPENAVDAILDYRALNGAFYGLGELMLVPAISFNVRQWLRFFVTIDTNTLPTRGQRSETSWWGHGTHDVLTRIDIPLYERDGWPWQRGIANRLRYTWKQGRHIDAGLRMEKDAGEALFTRDNPFWDSYGGHLMLKDVGVLRQLLVGDFKAGFGEGLVLNNGLLFDKTTTALWRTQGGIRPHRSTDEVDFLRGVAATFDFGKHWSVTALYSFRHLDATVAKDNTVSTISTSGLHRTAGELAHKGTLGSHTTAVHAGWRQQRWHAGATVLYQYYDHQFRRGTSAYQQIRPEGYQFGAVSLDYGYRSPLLFLGGETARSFDLHGGGWATLNKAAWNINPNTSLTAIQRFYSYRYFSPHATAFGENSSVQNESGLALLFDAERLGPFALRAFFDYFYSPWPRYGMTRSSDGWEGLLQTTWQPRKGRSLVLRYRVKSKEASDRRYYSHLLRATYIHHFSEHWAAQALASMHRYHEPATPTAFASSSTGFALAPRVDYTSTGERFRASLTTIFFRTDDFNSRLFLYEPSLLNSFGFQQLYGRGQRVATTLRLRTANSRWTVQTKLGVTHYSDRSTISSGFLRINSPWKPDLQFLLRLTLK